MWVRLQEDIETIFKRDPAARNKLEVLLCYPGLHAQLFHRLSHTCWNAGWTTLARFISHCSRFFTGIEIHPGAKIGRRVFIDHGMGIVIGETAEIMDDCTIYQGVTLGGVSLKEGKRHPTLGKGVVVGAGAKVLGPFTVGEGAKVGSNTVVTKEVPPNATAVGNPARMIVKDDKAKPQAPDPSRTKEVFAAYGVTQENPDDPLIKAMHGLIDSAIAQQERIEKLEDELKKAKGESVNQRGPERDDLKALNKLVDD